MNERKTEAERALFEAYGKRHAFMLTRDAKWPELYSYPLIQQFWTIWQARAALAPQGWRPIAEAPRDDTSILTYWTDGGMETLYGRIAHEYATLIEPPEACVTHWMPLPQPPSVPEQTPEKGRDREVAESDVGRGHHGGSGGA